MPGIVDTTSDILLEIKTPQCEVRIGEHQLLRIRRPHESGIERSFLLDRNSTNSAGGSCLQAQLYLTGFIRRVRDPLSVGRPDRVALDRSSGLRDVCNFTRSRIGSKDFSSDAKEQMCSVRAESSGSRPLQRLDLTRRYLGKLS